MAFFSTLKHQRILLCLLCLFALSLSFRHAVSHGALFLLLTYLLVSNSLRFQYFPGIFAIFALIVWQILTNFFGPYPGTMLQNGGITLYWLIIPILLCAITDKNSWYKFMQYMSIGIVIASIVAILQTLLGLDSDLAPFRISLSGTQFGRVVGLQSNPWVFSFLNGIAALLFIGLNRDAQWWKNAYIRYGLILICLICIMLAQIRAPMAALALAILILFTGKFKQIGYKKIVFAIICAITFFSIAAYMRESMFGDLASLNGRTSIWLATAEVVRQNPLWGVGHMQFIEHYQQAWDTVLGTPHRPWLKFLRNEIGHPHQDYFNLAVYYGIPALMAYLSFLLALIRWAWKIRHEAPDTSRLMFAILTFVFVAGLTENYLDYTASFYMMITAYVLIYKRYQFKIT